MTNIHQHRVILIIQPFTLEFQAEENEEINHMIKKCYNIIIV